MKTQKIITLKNVAKVMLAAALLTITACLEKQANSAE